MGIEIDIHKRYTDFKLDISFKSSSKRIGILGASGCGKTLTLKSVAGLIRPDKGRIVYDGKVMFDSERNIDVKAGKRGVGFLFQEYALFPNMTVEGNIKAALYGTGKPARHGRRSTDAATGSLEGILSRFDLMEVRAHMPHELSGGQKQRTALARMLVTDPDLILLDEPFSAMDTFLREGLRLELIRTLDMYDKRVILVSHDRDEIYQMCDRLILMDKGRVIAQGDTDELFEHPGTVAAARLTGCKNISRVEKLTDHRVRALDWTGIELITDGKVTDDVTHVGIRAHDFVPGNNGINVINCGKASVSRLPFEWYVTLENGLWWKLERALYDDLNENFIPESICVPPERILLLK